MHKNKLGSRFGGMLSMLTLPLLMMTAMPMLAMSEGGTGGGSGGEGGSGGSGDGGTGEGGASNGSGGAGGDGGSGDGSDGDGDGENLGEGGKKALATERNARKAAEKLASEREARIQELENATKTDEQKRTERLEQLEQADRQKDTTIASQEGLLTRYRVAAAKGLDLEAAERLVGSTKQEIEADADKWLNKWGATSGPQPVPGAGHRDQGRPQTAPGLGTLRAGYAESK